MALGTFNINEVQLFSSLGDPYRIPVIDVETALADEVNAYLQIHNARMQAMLADFTEKTVKDRSVYGGQVDVSLRYGDTDSLPRPSALGPGVTVGFPLDKLEGAVQYNKMAFRQMPLITFENQFKAFLGKDAQEVKKALARTIFTPTNRTFYDYLIDNKTIEVYAFLNADGNAIPISRMNGDTFDGTTHNHYMANNNSTLRDADLRALISNVVEHGVVGGIEGFKIMISSSLVSTVTGLSGFVPAAVANITLPVDTSFVAGRTLDLLNTSNRFLGLYDGFNVYVVDWIPAGYLLVVDTGAIGAKPVAWRVDERGLGEDFGYVYEDDDYPLRAQFMMRMFGFGAFNRQMVAVMQVVASTTYTAPVII